MAKASHQRALDTLVHRCGQWSSVRLRDGRVCMTFNVAWGTDLGEDVAHITTNISSPGPGEDPPFPYEAAFFRADEIETIHDADTDALIFVSVRRVALLTAGLAREARARPTGEAA